jgi:DNA-binding SARP family transcriptional activator
LYSSLSLSPREAELLLALALHTGPRDRATLAAMIWPDIDEKNASTVGVYVGRLRRRLGNLPLIESHSSGYRLSRPISVDLLLLEEALRERRVALPFDPGLEEVISSRHLRLPQWVLLSSWLAPYVLRFEEAIQLVRNARAAAAEKVGDANLAQHYHRLLAAEGRAT